ncbi:MAG: ABC transporter substrate-binding protein [Eubacterium sp.]|nr:ABC transporter substrate-binding protein [Eubacterium sp.]
MKKEFKAVLAALILGMVLVFTAAGCQRGGGDSGAAAVTTGESSYPMTVVDDLDQDVTFDAEPQRVVSLSPANTEILFALEVSDKVVGRTDYCNYPEEASKVESIGDYNAPNVEKILSLSPDLVLATDFIDDNVRSQLEAAGAKVMVFKATDIGGVQSEILTVGQVVNANDKAADIVDTMEEKYVSITKKCLEAETQKSVFIDIGGYYSSGATSLLGTMLRDINANNIAADTGMDWPQLSVEQIIAANPDVYISFYTTPEDIKKVPGFDQINAIKNDQIYYYEMLSEDSDIIQRPGPRIVDGLELLAKDVYPELF